MMTMGLWGRQTEGRTSSETGQVQPMAQLCLVASRYPPGHLSSCLATSMRMAEMYAGTAAFRVEAH